VHARGVVEAVETLGDDALGIGEVDDASGGMRQGDGL